MLGVSSVSFSSTYLASDHVYLRLILFALPLVSLSGRDFGRINLACAGRAALSGRNRRGWPERVRAPVCWSSPPRAGSSRRPGSGGAASRARAGHRRQGAGHGAGHGSRQWSSQRRAQVAVRTTGDNTGHRSVNRITVTQPVTETESHCLANSTLHL